VGEEGEIISGHKQEEYVITSKQLNALKLELSQHIINDLRSHPLPSEMLKKENLNVALVAAYESGMKEGARKEREDVLDQVRDRCAEKMSDRNPSISGVMLSYILADLRGGEL